MRKLEKLKLQNFEEICAIDQKSLKGGYEFIDIETLVTDLNQAMANNQAFEEMMSAYYNRVINSSYYNYGSGTPSNWMDGIPSITPSAYYPSEGEYIPVLTVQDVKALGSIAICKSYLDQMEISGLNDNRLISNFFTYNPYDTTVHHDEEEWGSAFINYAMKLSGRAFTNDSSISSWNSWGTETSTTPKIGDIAVSKDSKTVGIVSRIDNEGVIYIICGDYHQDGSLGKVEELIATSFDYTFRREVI